MSTRVKARLVQSKICVKKAERERTEKETRQETRTRFLALFFKLYD